MSGIIFFLFLFFCCYFHEFSNVIFFKMHQVTSSVSSPAREEVPVYQASCSASSAPVSMREIRVGGLLFLHLVIQRAFTHTNSSVLGSDITCNEANASILKYFCTRVSQYKVSSSFSVVVRHVKQP